MKELKDYTNSGAMDERREQFNYEEPTFKLQISNFYRQINWDESDDDEGEDSFSGETDTLFQMVETQMEVDESDDDDYLDDDDDGNTYGQHFFEEMDDEEFEKEAIESVYMDLFCQQSIISFETSQKQNISPEIQKAEMKWRKAYFGQSYNMKSPDKVSFDENITIHHLDDFEDNRKSNWIQEVADRERFERRIAECESILSDVFKRRRESQPSYK